LASQLQRSTSRSMERESRGREGDGRGQTARVRVEAARDELERREIERSCWPTCRRVREERRRERGARRSGEARWSGCWRPLFSLSRSRDWFPWSTWSGLATNQTHLRITDWRRYMVFGGVGSEDFLKVSLKVLKN
jgi:hypothetical protein